VYSMIRRSECGFKCPEEGSWLCLRRMKTGRPSLDRTAKGGCPHRNLGRPGVRDQCLGSRPRR
jgi:hypothetical protein